MADIYLISHQYVEYLKNKYHTYQAPDICKIDRFLTSVYNKNEEWSNVMRVTKRVYQMHGCTV